MSLLIFLANQSARVVPVIRGAETRFSAGGGAEDKEGDCVIRVVSCRGEIQQTELKRERTRRGEKEGGGGGGGFLKRFEGKRRNGL